MWRPQRCQLCGWQFEELTGSSGSGPGLDERQFYGSPTRPAGFGQRVQRIGWPDPTHCCPWPISGRRTGLPWNLTFTDTAEQGGDGDSGHSRLATVARQEIQAERLHPKTAYSRCRPRADLQISNHDVRERSFARSVRPAGQSSCNSLKASGPGDRQRGRVMRHCWALLDGLVSRPPADSHRRTKLVRIHQLAVHHHDADVAQIADSSGRVTLH